MIVHEARLTNNEVPKSRLVTAELHAWRQRQMAYPVSTAKVELEDTSRRSLPGSFGSGVRRHAKATYVAGKRLGAFGVALGSDEGHVTSSVRDRCLDMSAL